MAIQKFRRKKCDPNIWIERHFICYCFKLVGKPRRESCFCFMNNHDEFYADEEIKSQPETLRKTAQLAPEVMDLLPKKGEKVAVVGCGSSWFVSQSYAALREIHGHGESHAFTASEFIYTRDYDRVVAITRSGTTTETVKLLEKVKGKIPSVVLTAVPNSPVTQFASESIVMQYADERSVVQTRWVTAELGLLRTQ